MNWPTLSVFSKFCRKFGQQAERDGCFCCSKKRWTKNGDAISCSYFATQQATSPPEAHLNLFYQDFHVFLDTAHNLSTKMWVPLAAIFSEKLCCYHFPTKRGIHSFLAIETRQSRGLRGDVLRDGHRSGSLLGQGHQYGRCDLRRTQGGVRMLFGWVGFLVG